MIYSTRTVVIYRGIRIRTRSRVGQRHRVVRSRYLRETRRSMWFHSRPTHQNAARRAVVITFSHSGLKRTRTRKSPAVSLPAPAHESDTPVVRDESGSSPRLTSPRDSVQREVGRSPSCPGLDVDFVNPMVASVVNHGRKGRFSHIWQNSIYDREHLFVGHTRIRKIKTLVTFSDRGQTEGSDLSENRWITGCRETVSHEPLPRSGSRWMNAHSYRSLFVSGCRARTELAGETPRRGIDLWRPLTSIRSRPRRSL